MTFAAHLRKTQQDFQNIACGRSLERAKRMKDNFINRPEVIYRGVFALLAGNVNYLLTEEQSIPSIFVINCEQIVNFFACCLGLIRKNHIFIRQNVHFQR